MEQLRSLRATRDFVNAHSDVLGVRVAVREADGVPAAAAMGRLLRACYEDLGWEVSYLVRLEAAGNLAGPLSSARRAVARIVAKFGKELVCVVGKEDSGEEEDGDPRAARRGRRGARLQHGRHGPRGEGAAGRPRRGRHGALEDHLAQVGVAFADRSNSATANDDINRLQNAEDAIRGSNSGDLQLRAAALSLGMKEVRGHLRRFADRLASLEMTWATSSARRRSRISTTRSFRKRFIKLQGQREALLRRLEDLDEHMDRFAKERIHFA